MFLTGQSVDRLHVFTHLTRVCLRELSLHLTNQILLQTSANHVSALKLKPLHHNGVLPPRRSHSLLYKWQ